MMVGAVQSFEGLAVNMHMHVGVIMLWLMCGRVGDRKFHCLLFEYWAGSGNAQRVRACGSFTNIRDSCAV